MPILNSLNMPRNVFWGFILVGFIPGNIQTAMANIGLDIKSYGSAQHLICMRKEAIAIDRDPVFRLKVSRTNMTEEYTYREGRVGGAKTKFLLRVGGDVTCKIRPSKRKEAVPFRKFEGINELTCTDNEVLIVRRVNTINLVERGTEKSLIYEYNIHDGPPTQQKVYLSPDGANCNIRFLRMK
ncbi:MAG: hypothetical protein ACJZ9F_12515 [Rhodospirillaceae bacterium]